jgi:hypothetical protein
MDSTMSVYACLSCGGRYWPVQADGSLYFHVCPPLSINVAGDAIPRPDWRNENLASTAADSAGEIKAEGRGRRLVPPEELVPAPTPASPGILARAWNLLSGRKAPKKRDATPSARPRRRVLGLANAKFRPVSAPNAEQRKK